MSEWKIVPAPRNRWEAIESEAEDDGYAAIRFGKRLSVEELLRRLPRATPHNHATFVKGCFRCDLSRNEVVS